MGSSTEESSSSSSSEEEEQEFPRTKLRVCRAVIRQLAHSFPSLSSSTFYLDQAKSVADLSSFDRKLCSTANDIDMEVEGAFKDEDSATPYHSLDEFKEDFLHYCSTLSSTLSDSDTVEKVRANFLSLFDNWVAKNNQDKPWTNIPPSPWDLNADQQNTSPRKSTAPLTGKFRALEQKLDTPSSEKEDSEDSNDVESDSEDESSSESSSESESCSAESERDEKDDNYVVGRGKRRSSRKARTVKGQGRKGAAAAKRPERKRKRPARDLRGVEIVFTCDVEAFDDEIESSDNPDLPPHFEKLKSILEWLDKNTSNRQEMMEDWKVEIIQRLLGATSGSYDSYFLTPDFKRLRQRKDVANYLGVVTEEEWSNESAFRAADAEMKKLFRDSVEGLPLEQDDSPILKQPDLPNIGRRRRLLKPIDCGNVKVLDLGRVVDEPRFSTKKHIYPLGFTSECQFFSSRKPGKMTTYRNEVLLAANKTAPLFRVTDVKHGHFREGRSPTQVWCHMIVDIILGMHQYWERQALGVNVSEEVCALNLMPSNYLRALEKTDDEDKMMEFIHKEVTKVLQVLVRRVEGNVTRELNTARLAVDTGTNSPSASAAATAITLSSSRSPASNGSKSNSTSLLKLRKGISLKDLIRLGLLSVDGPGIEMEYQNMKWKAELNSDGQIVFEGLHFDTPSAFSIAMKRRVNPSKMADDGWRSCTYGGETLQNIKLSLTDDQISDLESVRTVVGNQESSNGRRTPTVDAKVDEDVLDDAPKGQGIGEKNYLAGAPNLHLLPQPHQIQWWQVDLTPMLNEALGKYLFGLDQPIVLDAVEALPMMGSIKQYRFRAQRGTGSKENARIKKRNTMLYTRIMKAVTRIAKHQELVDRRVETAARRQMRIEDRLARNWRVHLKKVEREAAAASRREDRNARLREKESALESLKALLSDLGARYGASSALSSSAGSLGGAGQLGRVAFRELESYIESLETGVEGVVEKEALPDDLDIVHSSSPLAVEEMRSLKISNHADGVLEVWDFFSKFAADLGLCPSTPLEEGLYNPDPGDSQASAIDEECRSSGNQDDDLGVLDDDNDDSFSLRSDEEDEDEDEDEEDDFGEMEESEEESGSEELDEGDAEDELDQGSKASQSEKKSQKSAKKGKAEKKDKGSNSQGDKPLKTSSSQKKKKKRSRKLLIEARERTPVVLFPEIRRALETCDMRFLGPAHVILLECIFMGETLVDSFEVAKDRSVSLRRYVPVNESTWQEILRYFLMYLVKQLQTGRENLPIRENLHATRIAVDSVMGRGVGTEERDEDVEEEEGEGAQQISKRTARRAARQKLIICREIAMASIIQRVTALGEAGYSGSESAEELLRYPTSSTIKAGYVKPTNLDKLKPAPPSITTPTKTKAKTKAKTPSRSKPADSSKAHANLLAQAFSKVDTKTISSWPPWAQKLITIREMPTNRGSRIRACIQETLAIIGDNHQGLEGVVESLSALIQPGVFKSNAAGPVKRTCLMLIADEFPSFFPSLVSAKPQVKPDLKPEIKLDVSTEGEAEPQSGVNNQTPEAKAEGDAETIELKKEEQENGGEQVGDVNKELQAVVPEEEKKKQKKKKKSSSSSKLKGPGLDDEMVQRCRAVVRMLSQEEQADIFCEPVDTSIFTDYLNFVQEPMDLSTIDKALVSGKTYGTPEAFIRDLNLVWGNCMKYNHPTSAIFRLAKSLKAKSDDLVRAWVRKEGRAARANPFVWDSTLPEAPWGTLADELRTPESGRKRKRQKATVGDYSLSQAHVKRGFKQEGEHVGTRTARLAGDGSFDRGTIVAFQPELSRWLIKFDDDGEVAEYDQRMLEESFKVYLDYTAAKKKSKKEKKEKRKRKKQKQEEGSRVTTPADEGNEDDGEELEQADTAQAQVEKDSQGMESSALPTEVKMEVCNTVSQPAPQPQEEEAVEIDMEDADSKSEKRDKKRKKKKKKSKKKKKERASDPESPLDVDDSPVKKGKKRKLSKKTAHESDTVGEDAEEDEQQGEEGKGRGESMPASESRILLRLDTFPEYAFIGGIVTKHFKDGCQEGVVTRYDEESKKFTVEFMETETTLAMDLDSLVEQEAQAALLTVGSERNGAEDEQRELEYIKTFNADLQCCYRRVHKSRQQDGKEGEEDLEVEVGPIINSEEVVGDPLAPDVVDRWEELGLLRRLVVELGTKRYEDISFELRAALLRILCEQAGESGTVRDMIERRMNIMIKTRQKWYESPPLVRREAGSRTTEDGGILNKEAGWRESRLERALRDLRGGSDEDLGKGVVQAIERVEIDLEKEKKRKEFRDEARRWKAELEYRLQTVNPRPKMLGLDRYYSRYMSFPGDGSKLFVLLSKEAIQAGLGTVEESRWRVIQGQASLNKFLASLNPLGLRESTLLHAVQSRSSIFVRGEASAKLWLKVDDEKVSASETKEGVEGENMDEEQSRIGQELARAEKGQGILGGESPRRFFMHSQAGKVLGDEIVARHVQAAQDASPQVLLERSFIDRASVDIKVFLLNIEYCVLLTRLDELHGEWLYGLRKGWIRLVTSASDWRDLRQACCMLEMSLQESHVPIENWFTNLYGDAGFALRTKTCSSLAARISALDQAIDHQMLAKQGVERSAKSRSRPSRKKRKR